MNVKQIKYLFISMDFMILSKVISLCLSAGRTVAWNLAKLVWY